MAEPDFYILSEEGVQKYPPRSCYVIGPFSDILPKDAYVRIEPSIKDEICAQNGGCEYVRMSVRNARYDGNPRVQPQGWRFSRSDFKNKDLLDAYAKEWERTRISMFELTDADFPVSVTVYEIEEKGGNKELKPTTAGIGRLYKTYTEARKEFDEYKSPKKFL